VAARPGLENRPVVLYETYRDSHRVAACSPRAEAMGVAAGMPLAEAKTLSGPAPPETQKRSPFLFEPYDPAADREALEKLAEACRQFSPLVALDDSPAPECLLLDVTGVAHLFGGEASLASQVAHGLSRRKLYARIAVADTVGAAWAVARYGRGNGSGVGVQSSGSSCTPPSPFHLPLSVFFLVPPTETAAMLRPLPVEALRLVEETVELLHQLGIYQIGQLEPLARGDLALRFGAQLVRRLDQATGRLAEPLCESTQNPPPAAREDLEHPAARRVEIESILEQLIGRVAETLRHEGRGAVQLECRLACGRDGETDLSVGLFRPSASASHLFELIRMRLEQNRNQKRLPGPVTAVEIKVAVAAPLADGQQVLFSDRPPQRLAAELAGLIDRLASRLGRRAVVRPRLRPEAQPELACCYDSLVSGPLDKRRRRRGPSWPERCRLPPRPLRLFERPLAVVTVSIVPEGPPLCFRLGGREHRVTWTWGPERIETGWWRGRPIGRDYYRIETAVGRRYWLFRRLRDGKWFLHGAFE